MHHGAMLHVATEVPECYHAATPWERLGRSHPSRQLVTDGLSAKSGQSPCATFDARSCPGVTMAEPEAEAQCCWFRIGFQIVDVANIRARCSGSPSSETSEIREQQQMACLRLVANVLEDEMAVRKQVQVAVGSSSGCA